MGGIGIKLNLSKCHTGQRKVKFLGLIVSEEGFRPDPGNVEAIVNMKPPTNVKETRRFLGMAGIYRKHIDKFSHMAAPLTDLTRKNQSLKWTVDCQQAFEKIKNKLVSSPILVKANLSKQFILETDASQHHVAAVLLQYDDEGLPRTVGYFSKKLKPVEVRYSTTDRKALAIVLACRQFNRYLRGTKFIIRTDHQPITTVFRQRTKSPRMNRWMLEMMDYRFKVEYKIGRNNVVADQVSRPVRKIQGSDDGTWLGKSKDEIKEMQRGEPRWREMVEYLEGGRIPRSKYNRTTLDQFSLEDVILYLCKQKVDGTILYLLIVPNELRKEAMRHIHEKGSGHLGQHKSVLKAEEFFYWPNLRKDVRAFVKKCVTCKQLKTSSGLQQQWQELPPVDQPMERVCIDVTEMGSGVIGQMYMLTVIDHFSRFVNLYPMAARTAETVVSKLDMVVEAYGAPKCY